MPRSVRLLEQVLKCVRFKHYSIRTEQQYLFWVKSFVRFHGLRHPSQMGAAGVSPLGRLAGAG